MDDEWQQSRTYRLNDLVDQSDASSDFLLRVSSYKTVKIFLGIFGVLFWSSFSFLNATLATNADLGSALPLHLLQAVTTGTDKETEEIDLRELLDRDVNLFRRTLRPLHLVVFDRGTEVRVVFHGTVDESDALFFELLAIADLASVSTTTMSIIRRGRGRRAVERGCRSMNSTIIEGTHAYRSRSGGMKSLRRSFLLISSSRR